MNSINIDKKIRISSLQLQTKLTNLLEVEKSVLRLLDDFHYAYGSHIQRLFFIHGTPEAMTRARNRTLIKLINETLIHRFPRKRLPGNRHGSTEHIYTLAHAGQRIMNELRTAERPYRSIEHTTAHYTHALTATELYVQMVETQRAGKIELLKAQGEPSCHRHFGIRKILKPDEYFLFRIVHNGQRLEVGWFIEVEHSRQGESTIIGKINTYRDYREHLNPVTEFMPRILFVTFTQSHYLHLEKLVNRNAGANRDLFVVKLFEDAIPTMLTVN